MELNAYASGAITAIVYLSMYYLLPKKVRGVWRSVIAIVVAVVICSFAHFITDSLSAAR